MPSEALSVRVKTWQCATLFLAVMVPNIKSSRSNINMKLVKKSIKIDFLTSLILILLLEFFILGTVAARNIGALIRRKVLSLSPIVVDNRARPGAWYRKRRLFVVLYAPQYTSHRLRVVKRESRDSALQVHENHDAKVGRQLRQLKRRRDSPKELLWFFSKISSNFSFLFFRH
jgi:hypothetical protein